MTELKHKEYLDEYNEKGNKTKLGQRSRWAQKYGIELARSSFQSMCTNSQYRSFLFEWSTYHEIIGKTARSTLFMFHEKVTKDSEYLSYVADEAASLEWRILVSGSSNLPVTRYNAKEILDNTYLICTKLFLKREQDNFYKKYQNTFSDEQKIVWKSHFKNQISMEKLKDEAIEKMKLIVNEKAHISQSSQIILVLCNSITQYYRHSDADSV